MKQLTLIALIFIYSKSFGQINEYSRPVQNNLEHYEPAPIDKMLLMALQAKKAEENKNKVLVENFLEYYHSVQSFKLVTNGVHKVKIIVGGSLLSNFEVNILDNKITSLGIRNRENGLKVTSPIEKAYCKIFLEDELIPIQVFIVDCF